MVPAHTMALGEMRQGIRKSQLIFQLTRPQKRNNVFCPLRLKQEGEGEGKNLAKGYGFSSIGQFISGGKA